MIGKTISHYKILEKLGEGGMGVVYKAEDIKLKRHVALKFLPRDLTRDEDAKKRFINEAQAASALDHQNIGTIYEIDETVDGQMFIAMAYYAGDTLKEKIRRGLLKLDETIDISIQVIKGLSIAHENGIIHRDIKPANIIITERGEVKLVDFGLAKLIGQSRITKTGMTIGTVTYMSPEQAYGAKVDNRTDIWSFGVVLYEMLTGRPPFRGDYEQAVIYSIVNEEPEPLSKHISSSPPHLEEVVSKTLEKEPANRFQNADEILASFSEIGAGSDTKKLSQKGIARRRLALEWRTFVHWLNARKIFRTVLVYIGLALLLFILADTIVRKHFLETKKNDEKISIAVMYFDNNTGDPELDWLSRGIPDMLITDLSQSKYLQVISRETLFGILRTMGMEQTVTIERSLAIEIARRAKAEIIVTGSIIKLGEMFRILSQTYDMRSDRLIPSEKVEGTELDIDILDQLSARIKLALEIEASGTSDIAEGIARTGTNSLEAYKYYIIGRQQSEKGYYPEAISNLTKAIQSDSTFAIAYSLLAHAHDGQGENSLAEEAMEKAIQSSEKLPRVEKLRILFRNARLKGDLDAKFRYIQQLAAMQPGKAYWHFLLGFHYYFHMRSYEKSIFEYQKAIEIDPYGRPIIYLHLGYTYLEHGLREEATSTFQKYVSLLPDDADSHDALGEIYLLMGDYEKALQELNTARALNPDYFITLKKLGDLYLAKGMSNEALRYYKRCLVQATSRSQEGAGHYYLGKFYLENGELDKAKDEIEKVLASLSDLRFWPVSKLEAYWILGLLAVKKGELDSAEVILERMEHNLRASGSHRLKELFHHLKGKIYLEQDRFDVAVGEFQQALKLGPLDHAYFLDALAGAYFKKGNFVKAIKTYNMVFEFNPNYAHSHYMLGQVYERQRKNREAIQEYEKLLEIWKDADEEMSLLKDAKAKLAN